MNEKTKLKNWQRFSLTLSCTLTAILSLGNLPAWADDPFRIKNTRDIGDRTEAAFKTIFLQGNYQTVREQLNLAEAKEEKEPLVYALQASIAYADEDWESIKKYANKTLETALALSYEDPVRGNLYLAVGHFLDGSYIYQKEGAVAAINKLQLVFKYFDLAEDNDPDDPELPRPAHLSLSLRSSVSHRNLSACRRHNQWCCRRSQPRAASRCGDLRSLSSSPCNPDGQRRGTGAELSCR